MHSAVDAGPFWNHIQLATIANYKTIGFHPSLHDSEDHKAEDTQPFLIIPQVPTFSWKWGQSNTESPLSFAEKGNTHVKTVYSRELIYCYQRTNTYLST